MSSQVIRQIIEREKVIEDNEKHQHTASGSKIHKPQADGS